MFLHLLLTKCFSGFVKRLGKRRQRRHIGTLPSLGLFIHPVFLRHHRSSTESVPGLEGEAMAASGSRPPLHKRKPPARSTSRYPSPHGGRVVSQETKKEADVQRLLALYRGSSPEAKARISHLLEAFCEHCLKGAELSEFDPPPINQQSRCQ